MLFYFEIYSNQTGEVIFYGAFADLVAFNEKVNSWKSILNENATILTKLYYGRFSIPFYSNHFSIGGY